MRLIQSGGAGPAAIASVANINASPEIIKEMGICDGMVTWGFAIVTRPLCSDERSICVIDNGGVILKQ
jgi:hypothetical protein